MMLCVFKGVTMIKSLVVLACAIPLLPAWAQSQSHGQSSAKAKPSQTSTQAKALAVADLTARLQARAVAEAAAQALALSKTAGPQKSQLGVGDAVANSTPALVAPNNAADAKLPAPMQPLPAWTELPPKRGDGPASSSLTAVQMMPSVPALAAVQPLTPVVTGLTATDPAAVSVSDPMMQDLAIAQQIHQGLMPCEMGASVRVEADAAAPGFFHVQGKGFRYRMYPVRTTTGALRLEDKKAGAVWLQLANKSMLMDQKKGRRVADECAHPDQVAYGQDMKTNPPPSLFDKTGMGRSND